jgi:uncharacterized protein YciI
MLARQARILSANSKVGGNPVSQLFAVIRTRGPKWDHDRPLRSQPLWDEHARFIDDLEAEGVIRLAGPLEGSTDALLIVRGDSPEAIEARLSQDPWTPVEMMHTSRISPWNLLVGTLD